VTAQDAQELLQQLCAELRLLRTQAGGPTLRLLSDRLGVGKSQLGAILNGQIRQLPDWCVVRGLVESTVTHARETGRLSRLSLPTGADEFWRHRYSMIEHLFDQGTDANPAPATPGTAARSAAVVPRQLPAPVRNFAGRAEHLAELTALLDEQGEPAGAVVISAIGGAAGVGKTALAVQWAHQVSGRFPDGQLYVNLRGFDPSGTPLRPEEALRGALDAFGVPADRIPAGLDALAGLYRSVLAGKRVLIVLDNARDGDQVRPLLPATPGCVAVITSRSRLAGLVATEGVHALTLDLFTVAEASDMLGQRLGPERLAADPLAVEDVIGGCARLPLALSIVAARAALLPTFPLRDLAADLRHARENLDAFAGEDPMADVRAVLSWSYDTLSPAAARLFRLLGVAPGPDIGVAAAASLAALPGPQTRRLLAELAGARLLTEHAPGRYTAHDLLRAYAVEQARVLESDTDRQLAQRRVLDHYLQTAFIADRRLGTGRDTIELIPALPGVTVEPIDDQAHALAWFAAEWPNTLAAADQAAAVGLDSYAWQLTWTLATYFDRQVLWREWASAQEAALAATVRLGEPAAQARAHGILARAYSRLGRYDDAHRHHRECVRYHGETGNTAGQGHAQLNIGEVYMRQGNLREALRHADLALDLYLRAGFEDGQAHALNNTGWLLSQLGDRDEAIRRCERALKLHQGLSDLHGEGTTWDSLGFIHHSGGAYPEAAACYVRAIDLFERLGDRYFEAVARVGLGDALLLDGQPTTAYKAFQAALDILVELDHPDVAKVQAKLRQPHDR
jgi:tetratricopeptide (TPR) repeat protein